MNTAQNNLITPLQFRIAVYTAMAAVAIIATAFGDIGEGAFVVAMSLWVIGIWRSYDERAHHTPRQGC